MRAIATARLPSFPIESRKCPIFLAGLPPHQVSTHILAFALAGFADVFLFLDRLADLLYVYSRIACVSAVH